MKLKKRQACRRNAPSFMWEPWEMTGENAIVQEMLGSVYVSQAN